MKKIGLLLILVLAAAAFYLLGGEQLLDPNLYRQWQVDHPVATALVFALVYVLVTALSLPGAAILTLVAGALFGLGWGLLIVSFASSLGATLACAVSRTLLRDWVQARFSAQLKTINAGVEKDGAFYLFSLRLIPLVPFFVINLVFGLTRVKLWTFYWVSQLGMLAGTAVYVNAGVQLAGLEELTLQGIMTPGLLGAFVLLGIFPWIARALMARLEAARVYRGWQKPARFDANLIVIGAGSAGLVSAYIAAAVKARVILIEKHKMGGDCLNTGCVPSKALIKSAAIARTVRHASGFGVQASAPATDWHAVMERVQSVIAEVEPHDSIERYTGLGVECVTGEARLTSPWTVDVNGKTLSARHIIVATGARPTVPAIPGLDQLAYLTSDTLWQLRENPGRLLVLGGGPIGCELAQAFAALGARVTQVGRARRLMPREDADVSSFIEQRFKSEGICLHLGAKVHRFEVRDGANIAHVSDENGEHQIEFDRLLLAVGRTPNVDGWGAGALGLETHKGALAVDAFLRTRFPNILACGDLVGPYQFTHMASHQAWYASVNALFGWLKKFKVDYSVVPWATFTAPEVARVGHCEQSASDAGLVFDVTRYGIDDLDRALADGSAEGFVKVITERGKDRILGATIVGAHASDLITEFVSAMKHKRGLNSILGTIHIYPTMSEANKYAAGVWKRANAPEKLLSWVKKLHLWRR